ncbi:triose-phosphate isomerase [Ketogulonicigenium vulgare]|uniref:triose-phosphate isomerase n=1 Tax=Ketogulonicigenium vulgare TaxID=92945 RepID=UPI002358C359|nr:triose-phosphate isomerase [Ketogulonicigenium vulgare]
MRRKIAAGNWKMFGTVADLSQIAAIATGADKAVDTLICPPATLIAAAAPHATASFAIGGQDCHPLQSGAYTGEISALMLRDAGATHVIVGHSERRRDHAETNDLVRAKAGAALEAGLTAVICVGESLEQREAGITLDAITAELEASLPEGCVGGNTIVAYEPLWAVGTGLIPTPQQIAEVHGRIRAILRARFGHEAEMIRILYGGSVKASNAAEIFAAADVDGALVGGASLKAADFLPIIAALAAAALVTA